MLSLRNTFRALLCCCGLSATQQADGQDLLDVVRDAHRATRESIRTLSCEVALTSSLSPPKPPSPQKTTAKLWYSLNATRLTVIEPFGMKVDYLWKDGHRITVTHGVHFQRSHVTPSAEKCAWSGGDRHRCDPHQCGLLMLNISRFADYFPFEQILEEASSRRAAKQTVGGKDFVVATLTFDATTKRPEPSTLDVYFDPTVSFLVRKAVHSSVAKHGRVSTVREVIRFRQCGPGVFFPERVEESMETDGKQITTTAVEFTEIRVNQPLPASATRMSFPYGIHFSDEIRKESYRVDSEGNQISKAIPHPTEAAPAKESAVDSQPQNQTEVEPPPAGRWILPASASILLTGVVAGAVRKYRERSRLSRQA